MDVFVYMKQMYHSTVVALQRGLEGETICNPANEHKINSNDFLVTIATEFHYREIQQNE